MIDNTTLAVLYSLAKKQGGTGSPGTGKDGREVQLRNNGTAIQWRYVGENTWKDLVLLSEITGPVPNLQVGSVTTLDPSEEATVSITGTPENPIINFGIPKGEPATGGPVGIESITNPEIDEIMQ